MQNHPYDAASSVVYTALEGDEAGTYTRGSGRLADGAAVVSLGETFAWVTNPDVGLTAHVTPRGQWADLYVESVSTTVLVVRSRGTDGAYAAFDYIVHGLRIGYEEHPVVQPRRVESRVPSGRYYDALYQDTSSLRSHTALARFLEADRAVHGKPLSELAGTRALRAAIGEIHEPPSPRPSSGDKADGKPPQTGPGAVALVPDDEIPSESASGKVRAPVLTGAPPAPGADDRGNVYARSFRPSATDVATLAIVSEPVEAGDVLVIDPEHAGSMSVARQGRDPAVFGIVTGTPGLVLGAAMPVRERDLAEEPAWAGAGEEVAVAVSGVVLCKVDASYGPVRPGDLLATSPTPGHAMRVEDPHTGTLLGKALESLEAGTGMIRILVTIR